MACSAKNLRIGTGDTAHLQETAHSEHYLPRIERSPVWYEGQSNVAIWRFPADFCQSRLGGRKMGSNACTLIALKMAEHIHREDLEFRSSGDVLNSKIVSALANSIIEGNEVHAREVYLRKLGPNEQNFNIPDALAACGHVLEEVDFHAERLTVEKTLDRHLLTAIMYWERRIRTAAGVVEDRPPAEGVEATLKVQKNLLMLLIADARTILLVYQPKPVNMLAFVDSHSHGHMGAIVATAPIQRIHEFCIWIARVIFSDSQRGPAVGYEISVLSHRDRLACVSPVHFALTAARKSRKTGNAPLIAATNCYSQLARPSDAPYKSATVKRHVFHQPRRAGPLLPHNQLSAEDSKENIVLPRRTGVPSSLRSANAEPPQVSPALAQSKSSNSLSEHLSKRSASWDQLQQHKQQSTKERERCGQNTSRIVNQGHNQANAQPYLIPATLCERSTRAKVKKC